MKTLLIICLFLTGFSAHATATGTRHFMAEIQNTAPLSHKVVPFKTLAERTPSKKGWSNRRSKFFPVVEGNYLFNVHLTVEPVNYSSLISCPWKVIAVVNKANERKYTMFGLKAATLDVYDGAVPDRHHNKVSTRILTGAGSFVVHLGTRDTVSFKVVGGHSSCYQNINIVGRNRGTLSFESYVTGTLVSK